MRILLTLLLLAASAAAHAQGFDCKGARFRGAGPEINEVHIFCGEIRDGKVDGYHSEVAGLTPSVQGIATVRPVGKQGVYSATVLFTNGASKMSTFFPRNCSVTQIEASVRYAAAHPFFGQRGDWTYGPSAPLGGGADYCVGNDGRSLELQFARTDRGGVNTAFPDGR